MNTEITLALIALVTNMATGFISYKQGKGARRKETAEATALEYESLKKMSDFYAGMLSEINTRLEEHTAHSKADRKKKYVLRSIIDWLSGIACTRENCPERIGLSQEEVDKITEESSIIDPDYEYNFKKSSAKA